MSNELNKKYGLLTAICTVVGTVIGSGVFFKAEKILTETGGNLPVGILAWIIGGLIMVSCAYAFSILATRHEKVSGIVDFAEALLGKKYAYFMGWFLALFYYPTLTSVLAWVSARYLCVLIGWDITGPQCMTISGVLLITVFALNTLAPKLAGKFQISSTIVKLVPIAFIAVVGTIIGLVNGTLTENFEYFVNNSQVAGENTGLFPAICSTIFAYEGWIVATSINSEIKDSKKNLPIALCIGTLIIVAAYTCYNLGILGLVDIDILKTEGTTVAFKFFGGAVASIINILVIISCLGTLNGLMLGGSRGIYSLSARGEGFAPETYAQVDKKTNMPHNSAAFSLMMCAVWFVYFILLGAGLFSWGKIDGYTFDSSELPIITLYAMYIPILISMMIKEKELGVFKRFVLPILSLCGIGVIIYASISKHQMGNVWYLIVFAVIMLVGFVVTKLNEKKNKA